MAENPFLDPSFHIRWSELTADRVAPAIETALGRAQATIDTIASRELSTVSYENTFLALEHSTEELNAAWARVSHLQSVADAPALREAHNAMLPKVSAFYAAIPLNAALWLRLKTVSESAAARALTGIHRRFLEETVKDFRQAGADLPVEKRARLEALQTELAQQTQKYSENVLDATNAWQLVVTDEARLAGLPAHAKAAARASAEKKGVAGWRFTLHQPSLEPFMTYLEDDALRREMWTASAAIGAQVPHDNTALIARILTLRAEKSALLGKAHFADSVLERRMAQSGGRALAFVEDFQARCRTAFARECRELEEFKAQRTGAAAARLAPWEIMFWAEKLRQARYDFDEEALRPYFPMDRVIAGLFELAGKIFGLRFTERAAAEVERWHPDVKYYDVRDARDRHVGSFYADWHPRESKRGGAWMNSLHTGDAGEPHRLECAGLADVHDHAHLVGELVERCFDQRGELRGIHRRELSRRAEHESPLVARLSDEAEDRP